MGLFVNKNIEHSASYTAATDKTIVIVGLGNVGKQYDKTRHNVGFACVDALQSAQSEFSAWQEKKALQGSLAAGTFGATKVLLLKPSTYMNESGRSVRAVLDYFKVPITHCVVVHDELDLPFGQIRTRIGGGTAGHNGIKSLVNHVGDNFGRVRIGIENGKPHGEDTSDFVLSKFSGEEQKHLPLLMREVQSILVEVIYRGELYPDTRNFIL